MQADRRQTKQLPEPLDRLQKHLEEQFPTRHGIKSKCQGAHGCRFGLAWPYVCVSCDGSGLFGQNDPKPDCIIAARHPARQHDWLWVVVEMTVDQKEPAEIVKQIRAGAEAIESKGLRDVLPVDLLPLYLERRGHGHVAARTALDRKDHRISFGDRTFTVQTGPCKTTLTQLWKELNALPTMPQR